MTDELVKYEQDGVIVTITLNRPKAMNALSIAMRNELAATFRKADRDDSALVIILTGAGKAFTAGIDLKELGQTGGDPVFQEGASDDPIAAMAACRKPIIGAINGVAITGGFEIAMLCDIRLASEEARFADTHGRVGILPGWGLSQRLSRTIGLHRAMELSFTGNFLDAKTADKWGLVNRVVPANELMATARQLAEDMTSMIPEALLNYKKLILDGYDRNFYDSLAFETSFTKPLNDQVNGEAIEARRSAIQERGKKQQG